MTKYYNVKLIWFIRVVTTPGYSKSVELLLVGSRLLRRYVWISYKKAHQTILKFNLSKRMIYETAFSNTPSSPLFLAYSL